MSSFTPRYASISDARAASENRLHIIDLIFIIELVSEGAVCEFCRVTAAEKKLRVCARCKNAQYVKTVILTKVSSLIGRIGIVQVSNDNIKLLYLTYAGETESKLSEGGLEIP
jgi:hypothetical protein